MSGFPVEIDVEEGENDAGENTFDDDDVDSGAVPLHLESQIRDPIGSKHQRGPGMWLRVAPGPGDPNDPDDPDGEDSDDPNRKISDKEDRLPFEERGEFEGPSCKAPRTRWRQISYVCGSLVNANWISSKFAIPMLAQRDLPIKSTLEQGSTTTLTGSRSIMRLGGGISPGSSSCTRRLRALLREMLLPCAYFRGLVFVLNQRWMSSLKPPCFIFPRLKR